MLAFHITGGFLSSCRNMLMLSARCSPILSLVHFELNEILLP